MFIGYQNELKIAVAQTREELEGDTFIQLTKIEEVPFAEMYNGVIYIIEEELIAAKQATVRAVRNQYLVEYVDGVVSNPLRWADMTEEEQALYINYRQYLLDYPESSETWYEQNPLTFDEWTKQD